MSQHTSRCNVTCTFVVMPFHCPPASESPFTMNSEIIPHVAYAIPLFCENFSYMFIAPLHTFCRLHVINMSISDGCSGPTGDFESASQAGPPT